MNDILMKAEAAIFPSFEAQVKAPVSLDGWYYSGFGKLQNQSFKLPRFKAVILLTNYRVLIFHQLTGDQFQLRLEIPYRHIRQLEKIGHKLLQSSEYGFLFKLITPLEIQVFFDKKLNIRTTLSNLLETRICSQSSFISDGIQLAVRENSDGWQYYDLIKEYSRMHIQINLLTMQQFINMKTMQIIQKHKNQLELPAGNYSFFMAMPHYINSIIEAKESKVEDDRYIVKADNLGYQLCESYPSFVAIPRDFNQSLEKAAMFRSSSRLPVICWTSKDTPVMLRSSQPMQGFGGKEDIRCFDRSLLQCYMSRQFPKLVIFDARPVINVVGNKMQGKGTESVEDYEFVEQVYFLNLENIHVLRQSFNEMRTAFCDQLKFNHLSGDECNRLISTNLITPKLAKVFSLSQINDLTKCDLSVVYEDDQNESEVSEIQHEIGLPTTRLQVNQVMIAKNQSVFSYQQNLLLAVHSSRWLEQKSQLLIGASMIFQHMQGGYNVLVHCSDGWDRTAQLTALSQLLLDPFYRTLAGFAVLISKEFCAFGHKFGERLGHIKYAKDPEEEWSPVFLLFLEAVAHLINNNQEKFEFDEDFLLFLAKESFSNFCGTFLFTCELELISQNAATFTPCVFANIGRWKRREVVDKTQLRKVSGYCAVWEGFWAMYLK